MKGTDVFPSKYLRAGDLDGHEPIVTIDRVVMETIGDDRKSVVYFKGKDKGLVLNKTNWNAIEDITGEEDSDNWRGHKIKLVTRKVEYQGKRVPAVRIEEPTTAAAKPAPEPEPVDDLDEESIPF